MPKAYSLDLRERVARFVGSGRSRHAAAAHFRDGKVSGGTQAPGPLKWASPLDEDPLG
jgi:hypothetical protein